MAALWFAREGLDATNGFAAYQFPIQTIVSELGGKRNFLNRRRQIALAGARTKNGEPHVITLSTPALNIIESASVGAFVKQPQDELLRPFST
jgi:hypothetical protein